GRLHLPSRVLSYAAAGHSGAFVHSTNRASQWLSSASLPLGFDNDTIYETAGTQLYLHDRLFLLSDGIYEVPSPAGDLWGRTRLQDTLEATRGHSLEQSISETMSTARQWLGGNIFPDDVALVGLEVLKGSVQTGSRA
ncbi:MAG: SpoIIE family protein phosphatase, partial [Nitrospira sp.]|nr:SpoIIE family protein phosphatase [Nitrospira sp.]